MLKYLFITCYVLYLGHTLYLYLQRRQLKILTRSLVYQLLFFGGIFMLLPFYWMVITSFKSFAEAVQFPPTWWPKAWHAENFALAWNAPPVSFGRYFYVSIVTAVASTAGTLFTAALAAYAFAWFRFWGRGLFFYFMLAIMMVPGQVLLIPNFVILQYLGWIDHFEALIVPWLASVFVIFLMRQFFMTIPADLWDAARVDGCGRFRFLWQIIAPLSKPVFITGGIFTFLASWNSLLWPLIVTYSEHMRTLMVGLQYFNTEAGSDFHLLMAASTMAILPVVVLFFFLQRFFIHGIARTGLKA